MAKMDTEQSSTYLPEDRCLPEDLVEKIVAMMPYPSIFKARMLSKSWLDRFSAVESQDDEAKKQVATRFQRQVSEWSSKWDSFCPVRLGEESSSSFHLTSYRWRAIPSLDFLPENLLTSSACLRIEGPLLFLRPHLRKDEIYVANILTRTYKQLPPRPHEGLEWVIENVPMHKVVTHTLSDTYKVIVFNSYITDYVAQIYDSESGAWTSKALTTSRHVFQLGPSVHLNGILYMVGGMNNFLLAFNIAEGTLEEVVSLAELDISSNAAVNVYHSNREEMQRLELPTWKDVVDLLVCNDTLLMIVSKVVVTLEAEHMTYDVVKVDLQSRMLLKVAHRPPPALDLDRFNWHPVSDGDFIFFGWELSSDQMLAYNVRLDKWSSFHCPLRAHYPFASRLDEWVDSSFRPGLNPFVRV